MKGEKLLNLKLSNTIILKKMLLEICILKVVYMQAKFLTIIMH